MNDLANLDSPIAQLGPLAVGDLLMIIQMQGATIDGTDTPNFGEVTALGSAGLYELVTVATITPCRGGRERQVPRRAGDHQRRSSVRKRLIEQEGRENNRRVEFIILEVKEQP